MTTLDQFFLVWFGFTSVMAFILFGYDKRASGRAGERVPERHLLVVAAMGGWLGGFLGMILFRHKTAKFSFQLKYAAAFVAWVAVVYLCWRWR